ncbi:MAG: type II CAAX endopeptidase family protein [Archangium sp.]|nr:type II CAAX endopeptidase family protein [Archangium sp.]
MSENPGEGVSEVVPPVPEAPAPPEPPAPPPPPPPPVDSRVHPIAVAIIALTVSLGTYLALSLVGSFINLAFSLVLSQLALLGVAVVVLRLSRRDIARFTGLVGSRPRAYLVGAAIGLGNALLFSAPLQVFSRKLFPEWLVKLFDMTELLSRMNFLPLEKWAFFLAAVCMAPIVEELLFRGVFFRALSPWNVRWAAFLSAGVFSAYHLDPVGFLARFEIGLLLAWLFWRTRSLGACIGAHAANNLLAMSGALIAQQGPSDPTEPTTLLGWLPVLAVGAMFFIPAARALWRSEPADWATPADDPEAPRRSFFAEVLPWATGLVLSIALMLRVDAAGAQLTIIDLTTPLRSAKTPLEHHERDVLQRLRRGARDGTGSVRAYTQLRRELQQREGR